MGVDKVILRAFLSTLAAVGILFLFMISALCAIFPSTMMEITYDMGMESSSIHFAERAYKNSEDIYYIAYATEVAIEEGTQDKIVACGEKFIQHENFDAYCQNKGEGQDAYQQFVYAQVCVAKYKRGDAEGAMQLACDSLQGKFPKNNALVAVLMTAIYRADLTVVQWGVDTLQTLQVEGEDVAYLNETLQVCNKALNG